MSENESTEPKTNPHGMAAEFLKASASAYAAYATTRLFERLPEAESSFGATAFQYWKSHFVQRLDELSAALAENVPKLFVSHIRWASAAFQARNVHAKFIGESLLALQDVLKEEMPPAAQKGPVTFLDIALSAIELADQLEAPLDIVQPGGKLAAEYLTCILDGDSQSAIQKITDSFQQGASFEELQRTLLIAQSEVGRMWHVAEVSVAEEHFVTLTTERTMAVLGYLAKKKPGNGKTIVSAAVAGNNHHIGVRAVSDRFEVEGWKAICLGSDTPSDEIASAVDTFSASLVLLSASMSTQLKSVRKAIDSIRSQNPDCRILIGGLAFRDAKELWKSMNADGYAEDADQALQIAAQLFPELP